MLWVAGHEGHWGNEAADKLAKAGTESQTKDVGYLPQSLVKQAINTAVKKHDTEVWSTKAPRHSRLTLTKNKTIINEFSKLENNRKDYRIAVQLTTGRAALNYTLHQMSLVSTKECPQCGADEETVAHFLGQCPAYSRIRGEVFGDYYMSLTDIFQTYSLKTIVKFANKTKRLHYDPAGFRDAGVT